MPLRRAFPGLLLASLLSVAACSATDAADRAADAASEPSPDPGAAETLFPDTAVDDLPGAPDAAGDDPDGSLADTHTPLPDLAEPDPGAPDVPADPGGGGDDVPTPPVHYCKPGTLFIYVANTENHLMRFDPISATFTDVGLLACETGWLAGTPFSMAIDRQATAWILYDDGKIFRVSTDDASCMPVNYVSGQQGFQTFGMGFASNTAGSNDETLFVSNAVLGAGSSELGTLTFPSLTLSVVGPTPAGIGSAELSGNGLGELWAFFPNGSKVAQVDKATATLSNEIPLPSGTISDARAWAFATWGGDFYLFFAGQWDASSSVYRVRKDGTFETLLTDTGWNITGAGVSSCAPTSHP